MDQHFCTCPSTGCPLHPANHDQGCDPCIKDNLETGCVPNCLFRKVNDDISDVRDFTIQGFIDYHKKHKTAEE